MSQLRARRILAMAAICVACAVVSARASTKGSYNLGPNLGVVNYTLNHTTNSCQFYSNGILIYATYYLDYYSNINYVNSAANINQGLPNFSYLYGSPGPNAGQSSNCPADTTVNGPLAVYNGTNGSPYTIDLYPGLSAIIYAQGYLNLKYVVLAVYYAPPSGDPTTYNSTVSYTNSDLVSSTISSKATFSSSYTESQAVVGSGMAGYKNGSVDTSGQISYSWTNTTSTTDSTAVTIEKATGTTITVSGPACGYCGIDHDYDVIAVWLNPVQLFTLTNGGVVQPNGYGYSTLDQPGMDIWYVYAGELNGILSMRAATQTEFARAWAASEFGYPGGPPGPPGLSSQDEQTILQMDPYFNCTWQKPVSDTTDCPEPADPSRFTEATVESFPYQQPVPGGQPIEKKYKWTYTTTDQQGVDKTVKSSQTFGLESVFGYKIFGLGIQDTLQQSWTTETTYESSTLWTAKDTSEADADIFGPACNVVNGACSPVYPPPNAYNPITCQPVTTLATAFGQGDNMYLYQDNLFGTFLMEPYGQ